MKLMKTYPANFISAALFFGFFAMMVLPSCSWFKPATDPNKEKVYKDEDIEAMQGTKVFDQETGTWRTVREVSEKLDTVKWTELSASKYPPITNGTSWNDGSTGSTGSTGTTPTPGANPSLTYNVSLVLPFFANRTGTAVGDNSLWAINYYAGAKMAYDELDAAGAKLSISVMDTEGSAGKMTALLSNGDFQKSHLVIGPVSREDVTIAEAFTKKNNIPLVSPYTAQMGLAENNHNFIQVNPSLKSHCEAITEHVRKRFRTEDVVLVSRSKEDERSRLKYFQDANAVIEGRISGSKFTEYIVSDETADFRKMNIAPYVRSGRTTVFIVPSWSSETFIYSLMRQLMVEQAKGADIIVYGMPQWMDFEQIDFDFYEKLKVHISSASYVDDTDERVIQFKREFFHTYGTIPSEEAFLGYDVMLYFGKLLHKYGSTFTANVDREPADVLHGRFEFERVVIYPEEHRESSTYYDQLENTFVNILEFKDFHFQPAD